MIECHVFLCLFPLLLQSFLLHSQSKSFFFIIIFPFYHIIINLFQFNSKMMKLLFGLAVVVCVLATAIDAGQLASYKYKLYLDVVANRDNGNQVRNHMRFFLDILDWNVDWLQICNQRFRANESGCNVSQRAVQRMFTSAVVRYQLGSAYTEDACKERVERM